MNSNAMPPALPATPRRALKATEIVTALAKLEAWTLSGDGTTLAIEKTYTFPSYHETIAFVNVVAFIAERRNHHPELAVHFNRCVVRFNTHDVQGISSTDFECASHIDTWLSGAPT